MTEIEAVRICDIIAIAERCRLKLEGVTEEAFLKNLELQEMAQSAISNINNLLDVVDRSYRSSEKDDTWMWIKDVRNKLGHRYGSVSFDLYWTVLTVSLPQVEADLRARIAGSIFDCDEIHARIGGPFFGRDLGTEREIKDSRKQRGKRGRGR